MAELGIQDRTKLHEDAAFVGKETRRKPAPKPAPPTLGGLKNLTPRAQALQSKYLAKDVRADIAKRQWDAHLESVGSTAEVKFWQNRDKPGGRREKLAGLLGDAKSRLLKSDDPGKRARGGEMDIGYGPEEATKDSQDRTAYDLRTMGPALDNLIAAQKKAYNLGNMAEVMDIDLARKTQLADPRYVADAARARVAAQFEKKRLLNSFRKPSNPIMMVSGGRAIYRGGVSEEDQIDMLEEQTMRHLSKRKRLGMPLLD